MRSERPCRHSWMPGGPRRISSRCPRSQRSCRFRSGSLLDYAPSPGDPDSGGSTMPDHVLTPPDHSVPVAFTRAQLEWLPWLEPLAAEAMTERHVASLVDAARVKSPYFRLLARDPDALEARTRTDKDIFYNTDAGLPRAERELAAAATSRVNGCIYCASVHARFAATYSKRETDVDQLLDNGVTADLGERWNAIIAASAAMTATPIVFGPEHVA